MSASGPSTLSVALAGVGITAFVISVVAVATYYIHAARRKRRQHEHLPKRNRKPIAALIEEAKRVGETQHIEWRRQWQREAQRTGQSQFDVESGMDLTDKYSQDLEAKAPVLNYLSRDMSSTSLASTFTTAGPRSGPSSSTFPKFSTAASALAEAGPSLTSAAETPRLRKEKKHKRASSSPRRGRASSSAAVPAALIENLGELPQLPAPAQLPTSNSSSSLNKAKRTSSVSRKPVPSALHNVERAKGGESSEALLGVTTTSQSIDDLASYTPVLDLGMNLEMARYSASSYKEIEGNVDFAHERSMWLASTFQQQQQPEKMSLEEYARILEEERRTRGAGFSKPKTEQSEYAEQRKSSFEVHFPAPPPRRQQQQRTEQKTFSTFRPLSLGLSMSSSGGSNGQSALVAGLFDDAVWTNNKSAASARKKSFETSTATLTASESGDDSEAAPSTAATSIHSSQSSESMRYLKHQHQQEEQQAALAQLPPLLHQLQHQNKLQGNGRSDGIEDQERLGFNSHFHNILYPEEEQRRHSGDRSPVLAELLTESSANNSKTPMVMLTPTAASLSPNLHSGDEGGSGELTPTQASISTMKPLGGGSSPRGFASSLRARLTRNKVASLTPSTPSTYAPSVTEQWIVDTTTSNDELELVRRTPDGSVGLGLGMVSEEDDHQSERGIAAMEPGHRPPSVLGHQKRRSNARISMANGPVLKRVSVFDGDHSASQSPWMLARYDAQSAMIGEGSPQSDACDTLGSCLTDGTETMGQDHGEAINQRARLLESVQAANKAKMLNVTAPSSEVKPSTSFISHSPRFSVGQSQNLSSNDLVGAGVAMRKAPVTQPNLQVDSKLANAGIIKADVPPTPPYTPVDAVKNAAAAISSNFEMRRKMPSASNSASSIRTLVPAPAPASVATNATAAIVRSSPSMEIANKSSSSSNKLRPLSLVASVAAASSPSGASAPFAMPSSSPSNSSLSTLSSTAMAGNKLAYRRKPTFDHASPNPATRFSYRGSTSFSSNTLSSLHYESSIPQPMAAAATKGTTAPLAYSGSSFGSGLIGAFGTGSPSTSSNTLNSQSQSYGHGSALRTDNSPSFLAGPDKRGSFVRSHGRHTSSRVSMSLPGKTLETLPEVSMLVSQQQRQSFVEADDEEADEEEEDEEEDEDLARFRAMKRRLDEMGLHHPAITAAPTAIAI